jgi:hypothetical protein
VALRAKEIAIASAEESAAMGLPEAEHGILFALSDDGPVTLASADVDYVRVLQRTPHLLEDLTIPADKFPVLRRGW